MANGFLCAVFPYLLGLTLLLFLIWALLHLARRKSEPDAPIPASVGILWLTPACAAALGRCSQPGRLRSMSARGISARLDRYDLRDERRPTREQYSTWPEQADLICQGKFDELAKLQDDLKKRHGVEGEQPEPARLTASRSGWTALDALLALAFSFAVLAILCLVLTDFLRKCAPVVQSCKDCPTICPPLPKEECKPATPPTLKLSTDQVFEYNESEVVDSERFKEYLKERLATFKNASLKVTGFTDPIGGACFNEHLAKERVGAISRIIREISPDVKIEPDTSVQPDELPEEDKKIAAKCLATFQDFPSERERERPLRRFTKDEREARKRATNCTPDEKDLTPNHILGRECVPDAKPGEDEKACVKYYKDAYDKGPKNSDRDKDATLVAMQRANHFYRILRCFAPLRRVEIKDSASGAAK